MNNKLQDAFQHFKNEKEKLQTRLKFLDSFNLKAQRVLVGDLLSFVLDILSDIQTAEKKNFKALYEKYISKDEEFVRLGIECQNHNFNFQAEFYREISRYSGRIRFELSNVC